MILCFNNLTEIASRRGENTRSRETVALDTERRHFVLGVRRIGGRNRRPQRPQLARMLRHVYPNPQLVETNGTKGFGSERRWRRSFVVVRRRIGVRRATEEAGAEEEEDEIECNDCSEWWHS
jgi:hypothetical protein